ncbi:hypothetical protein DNI29_19040 [Hymenobacter sediminis]|uniref:hypothetical protein n=1 Tax=Hymenobacter sediminis TaxID=2218621 RepID=UPI000DA6C28B|nr:hypothetical protein [Hymenobacter sediminis]RPD45478.1 hypothetical protein DNI29_19040 [Hymenobacter sediminis]
MPSPLSHPRLIAQAKAQKANRFEGFALLVVLLIIVLVALSSCTRKAHSLGMRDAQRPTPAGHTYTGWTYTD